MDVIRVDSDWAAEIYRSWRFPPEVISAWDSLAGRMGDVGVFLRYGWFKTFWDAFGDGHEPVVVVLRFCGTTRAIFPCWRSVSSNGKPVNGTIESLTNDHTCHYDVLVDPETKSEAIPRLARVLRRIAVGQDIRCDSVSFSGSNLQELTRKLRRTLSPVHVYSHPWAPRMKVTEDWEVLWQSLPRKLRSSLRNRRSRAAKEGQLSFDVMRNPDNLDAALDVVLELESSGWKGIGGTAINCMPELLRFYRGLAAWAKGEGRLLLFFLRLRETPIAASLCLHCEGTVFGLKQGFDESFATLSPGSLLMEKSLEYLSKSAEFQELNFAGGCDAWKAKWTQSFGCYGLVHVYPRSVLGWGRYVCEQGWKDAIRQFKTFKRLKARIDGVRSRQ